MGWRKAKSKRDDKVDVKMLLEEEYNEDLGDEEFLLSEEIDGYDSCSGLNGQRCSTECFRQVMMPTVTVWS